MIMAFFGPSPALPFCAFLLKQHCRRNITGNGFDNLRIVRLRANPMANQIPIILDMTFPSNQRRPRVKPAIVSSLPICRRRDQITLCQFDANNHQNEKRIFTMRGCRS